ncbi:MAG: hypothetical protein K2H98_02035, partial [Duncaniella sp.]|nr:hypothetical protein [Duncaniella sp.]
MVKRLLYSQSARLLVGLVLISCGVLIVLGGSVYGFHCCDTPYMMFNIRTPERGPVAMLTFRLAHLWCECFGYSFESLGWLRSICSLVTFGIGCGWMAVRTRRYLLSAAVFFVVCLLGEFCQAHYFNWDTGVFPWFVINAIIALEYVRRPSRCKVILMGIFLALLVMARFPAAVCSIIDFILVIYMHTRISDEKKHCLIWDILSGITAFIITVIGLMIAMCGSVSGFIGTLVPDNFINGHFSLISYYYRLQLFGPVIATWGATMILVAGAWFASVSHCRMWKKVLVVLISYIICVNICSLANTDGETPSYGLGQALMLVAVCTAYYQHRRDNNAWSYNTSLVVIMAYAVSAAIGSDSIAWRLLGLPVLPLAAAYIDYDSRAVRVAFKILVAELSVMGLCHSASTYRDISHGRYVKVDSLPAVGIQYATPDDMAWIGWAADARECNDLLKQNDIKVAYMGGFPMMG